LLNSFKKHIASTHYSQTSKLTINVDTTSFDSNELASFNSRTSSVNTQTSIEMPPIQTLLVDNCNNPNLSGNQIEQFLASLYPNSQIPRSVVQTVTEGVTDIIRGIRGSLVNCAPGIPPNISDYINTTFQGFESRFSNLNTEYKRIKYYTDCGSYISPTEIIIGQRLNENRNNNTFSIIPTHCTEQFIPMRDVLKKFFQLKDILKNSIDYVNETKSCDAVLMNFTQGSVWKNKMKDYGKNQIVFPIFLFFDDYEVGNPLGSHSGTHKLGAVYFTFPCIPIHLQSSLSNIFLALLFHSSDRQQFGNHIIFSPLINELNYLKETGIEIESDEFKGNIKFELGLIVGDNLGIHSITGFVESFSSNYPCRVCKIRKEDMRKQCYADVNLIRSLEQYNLDLLECDVTTSGIKDVCVWHDVCGFNVLDQSGMDIMHDLLEGVCKFDMAFLLNYYIYELNIFSLQILNERMINFDYGPDSSSKRPVLNIENIRKNNIRLSASEMLVLVRYFGLLIGDFVPKNDPVWHLYILLRQILDLVTSMSLQIDSCELLKILIAEHHDLYLRFSKQSLKPKHHFMSHYHTMLKKIWPPCSIMVNEV